MERDPPDATLVSLENTSASIVGDDWSKSIDRTLLDNLGKYRKYDGTSVRDLLRVLRNKVRLHIFSEDHATWLIFRLVSCRRNITTKTCPTMSGGIWEICREGFSRILQQGFPDFCCTSLTSWLSISVTRPCFKPHFLSPRTSSSTYIFVPM